MSEEKKPEDMLHLPEGVSAVGVSPDGNVTYVLDPFLLAFLYSGIVLRERAGDTGAKLEWPQASVI